jgi:hypothetical protein
MGGKRALDLVQQVKKTEKRAKIVESTDTPAVKTEQTVTFDIWWSLAAKRLNLQPHIKEIVWADFKSRGLKLEEPEIKFIEALRLFGYKL